MLMKEKFAERFAPENIAPAIRGCVKRYKYPVVAFQSAPASGLEEAAAKTGLSFLSITGCFAAGEVYDRLEGLRSEVDGSDVVSVENLGLFAIAGSREAAEKKLASVSELVKYDDAVNYDLLGRRLEGRVIVVTGGAQGFGKGIAEILAENGAQLIIADLNAEKARAVAEEINARTGSKNASSLFCDVSSEESIIAMCETVTREYGGIDAMHSNAGICEAGSLEELSLSTFEAVTRINYVAFFLVCKYASRPMKIQYAFDSGFYGDIIQTNSKAGLKGWLKNSAYCGSKFGSIGLVQSISRELVEYHIKVNAVCPGNYYDGPLWSDPEKGLFTKYFKAGKIAGAKSPEDVKNWYFSQEIFYRGCYPIDVARAVMYCIEQLYETGQALPVAGGLDMLS